MTDTVVIPNRGRAETDALTRALINLAARGLRTHDRLASTHHRHPRHTRMTPSSTGLGPTEVLGADPPHPIP